MATYYLYNWGMNGSGRYNLQWDIITHQSSVVVTAAEGAEPHEGGQVLGTTASPERFVGDARFTVHNVAPHDGGVGFYLEIDWPAPLNVWTCVTVLDAGDYAGMTVG
jgi:hypothetical protein